MQPSTKWTLNQQDVLQVLKWFFVPNLLLVLTAYVAGTDWRVALGMGCQGLLTTAIYALKKFQDS
jgi:hypothetical protein